MDKIMYLWHRLSNKYLKQHHSYFHQLKNSKTINIYTHTYIWFWRYLTRGLIWHLNQSFIRTSIYFSLIVKSRSNSFLEKTVTRVKFLVQLNNGSLRWGSNPWLTDYNSETWPTEPHCLSHLLIRPTFVSQEGDFIS